MPTFERDGINLYYHEQGSGFPVVLLHGFTTSLVGNWQRRGWLDLLADQGFCVIALDFPSHGRSDRAYEAARCSTESLAADVVALLDRCEIPVASLIGFSMGGGVALRLALDHPTRVAKLVVGGIGDSALNELHDPKEIEELIAAFEADAGAHPLRRNAELAGNDPAALLPYLRHGGWPGGLAETGPIEAPVMVLVAEHDEYMRGTQALLTWLGHATVLGVEGRGHHDVLDDEGVKEHVLAFLA
jgi:pimeloyl-ACP methyl ester carboxylesterase